MLTERRRKLAVIHIAKQQLGLCDERYRALLGSAAGVRSAADLRSDRQYQAVLTALRRAGYRPRPRRRFDPDPQMTKCYALWCDLHRRGAVQAKGWSSMMRWIDRRLGGRQDIIRRDQKRLLIEELKAWQRRIVKSSESKGGV